jgi:DNA invertase Pin-like site-specific DNA recombinase
MTSTTKPRVVGYVRGSTDEQQNTLVVQRQQIEAYCTFKQLDLVGCFVDEGESAFSVDFFERPIAAEMITRLAELGATAVVITKLDRGFRNALDCLFTVQSLEQRGIGLHLLDLQLDPTSPTGKLLLTMLAAIAEFENKRRSERQIGSFQVMRQQGQRTGSIPYGWDTAPSSRTSKTGRAADDLIPNAVEQEWLVLFCEGDWKDVSANEVARRLNQRGVPAKRGGKWYGASVASVREHAIIAEPEAAAA